MFLKSMFLICPDNLNAVSITQTMPLQSHERSIVVCLKTLLRKIQVTGAPRLSVVMNVHEASSKKADSKIISNHGGMFQPSATECFGGNESHKATPEPCPVSKSVLGILHSPIHLLTHSLVVFVSAPKCRDTVLDA